jgi:internalin A
MHDQAKAVSRPWRRFLRFSVRGSIVLVLGIGAGLGWIVHQAHVQRDAVIAIKKAGGSVMYDWEWSNGMPIPGVKSPAPGWLIDFIGVDHFGHVNLVILTTPSVTDATLAHVGRLTRLQELYVSSPSVSDAGLEHLSGLTNLSILSLSGTPVSNRGLAKLKGLIKLFHLNLSDTQITDSGLISLKRLTKLSSVMVGNTQVTDAGVKELNRARPNLTIYR